MTDGYVTPAAPLRAIVDALLRGGVRDVVICPGSRSTPLALALRAATDLVTWVHLDERSGAFFALGAAKATGRPAAILATSGTAVVNFAPAVVEARYGRVPLILLTADRPPELQGIGAPQTIDQHELFGRHAKWFGQLPVPDTSAVCEERARAAVERAVAVAMSSPAGPVQINLPFREPLLPVGPVAVDASGGTDGVRGADPAPSPTESSASAAIASISRSTRGLLVCGPLDLPGFPAAVARLGAAAGFPILADALSGVRAGPHDRSGVVAHHDLLLRSSAFRGAHEPDLIVRFGARPTSKTLDRWLDGLAVPRLLVDDGGGWNRPDTPSLVEADPRAFAGAATAALGDDRDVPHAWLEAWQNAEATAARALDGWFDALGEPFEGAVARALAEALPDAAVIVVGNSMPVRDADTFGSSSAHRHRWLGNRGANGIDGMLSTALGLAAGQHDPVVAVLGDLAFLHDLNALVAARRLDIDATVVLVDNDGGGIFSFLPQARSIRPDVGLPEHFEELFGTPHGIEFGPVIEALGARHRMVGPASLVTALREVVGQPGLDVLQLRTDRARNVELHQAAHAAVMAALEPGA